MSENHPVVEITDVAHGGSCIGRLPSGKVVFVRHTAPGELVRVALREERAKRAFGDAIEVLRAHPQRRAHVWPLAAREDLGGAELGHLTLTGQRAFKEAVLTHTLRRIGGVDVAEAAAEARRPMQPCSPHLGGATRTRLRTIANEDGRVAMRRFHSHDLVALDTIPLAVDALADVSDLRFEAGTRLRHVAPSAGPVQFVPEQEAPVVHEQVAADGTTFRYRLGADQFWQAHLDAPRLLIEAALAGLRAPGDPNGIEVLELYSGVGLLSAPIARAIGEHGRLTCVEGSAQAVRAARHNCPRTVQVHKSRIDHRTVGEMVAERTFDAVVLDPPRSGAGERVAAQLASHGATAVVMIYCDPAAFARDIAPFLTAGYRVEMIQPFDLFEHTHHMEIAAHLTRP
ncbi:MAG: TRAM domain-containing protein [Bowdeniella nasicola]|nr:TRAM domain-containing protein [Bowdeniella nasicola]